MDEVGENTKEAEAKETIRSLFQYAPISGHLTSVSLEIYVCEGGEADATSKRPVVHPSLSSSDTVVSMLILVQ